MLSNSVGPILMMIRQLFLVLKGDFMNKLVIGLALCILLIASNSFASIFWTATLQNWTIYVNNSVVYVSASNMPSNCSYQRAQINTSADFPYSQQNNKDLYAYILSASITGKSLSVVVDDIGTCSIYGANAW